jgi:hypothetical protein
MHNQCQGFETNVQFIYCPLRLTDLNKVFRTLKIFNTVYVKFRSWFIVHNSLLANIVMLLDPDIHFKCGHPHPDEM